MFTSVHLKRKFYFICINLYNLHLLKGMSRQIFYLIFFITCIEYSLKVIPAMVK